jgi:hypothetical protein
MVGCLVECLLRRNKFLTDAKEDRISFRVGFKILSLFLLGDFGISFLNHTRNLTPSRCYFQKCEFFQQLVKNHINMMSSANKHSSHKTNITNIKQKCEWHFDKKNHRIVQFSERQPNEKCCLMLLERRLGYLIFGPKLLEDPGNMSGHFALWTYDDESSSLDYW